MNSQIIERDGNKVLETWDEKGNLTKEVILGKSNSASSTLPTVKSGALVIDGNKLNSLQKILDSNRGSDGYTNTKKYLDILNSWMADGGLQQGFFTQFPPKNYLNPKDSTVPQYNKDQLKSTTSTINISQQDMQNVLNNAQ